jgi:beta-N-acetylhexosaminidase
LPVTVCEQYKYGAGIYNANITLTPTPLLQAGMDLNKLSRIDSIAQAAIQHGATPGCMVLVVKNGTIAWHKAYGHFDYNRKEPVSRNAVYDMASVTKTCATTLAIMKLYEQGKIHLDSTLGSYLPITQSTDKAGLSIRNILLHQAGLVAYIPFFRETTDTLTGAPLPGWYSSTLSDSFTIPVAKNMYLKTGWADTMMKRILQSPVKHKGKYVYSDNDFIFLGKLTEAVSGIPLQQYVAKEFYMPMALSTAGYLPQKRIPQTQTAPTENEAGFRQQLLRGYVHDPGAAMFGGVAGHAGLFSNAYDMAAIMQMLINGGEYNGKRYLKKSTVQLFTQYGSSISRRGLGFDKPEKDNANRPEPYPCLSASARTFGHTGFTGTCAWADPENQLVFVFLSNRVSPEGDNTKLLKMNIRPQIHQAIYDAIVK